MGARFRRRNRRRSDSDREHLRPAWRRPVRRRVDSGARRAADHGDRDVYRRARREYGGNHRRPLRLPRSAYLTERVNDGKHLLEVDDLTVSFETEVGTVRAVDHASFFLNASEILCLVGESGSGKSVMTSSLIGLTRAENASFSGTVHYDGVELISAPERTLERIRGGQIAVIPQDPMTALDPVLRIGDQIAEQIRAHTDVGRAEAFDRAVELMDRVGIPQARTRIRAFVHEFSGGMRQRIMIAMAL